MRLISPFRLSYLLCSVGGLKTSLDLSFMQCSDVGTEDNCGSRFCSALRENLNAVLYLSLLQHIMERLKAEMGLKLPAALRPSDWKHSWTSFSWNTLLRYWRNHWFSATWSTMYERLNSLFLKLLQCSHEGSKSIFCLSILQCHDGGTVDNIEAQPLTEFWLEV